MKTEEVEHFSNFHPLDGIQTPFQIKRERNRIKIYQVFFDNCQYNTGLADSLFTRESLDDQDGNDLGVYAQRYNAAGVAQGSEFQVNTYTTERSSGSVGSNGLRGRLCRRLAKLRPGRQRLRRLRPPL